MKQFLLLLSVVVLATSCSVSRRVSREAQDYWIGRSAVDIMRVMGDPDSIDVDGKDGSILRYEMKPDSGEFEGGVPLNELNALEVNGTLNFQRR